jgi:Peptidase family S41/PDZ domain
MRGLWLLFLAWPALGQLTMDQKLFDFQALAGLYAKHYAGHDWKLMLYGFDSTDIGPWLDRVNATTSDLDFYELMVEYVSDLHDGHDAYHLPSTFSARLGFTVDIYDGNVVIDSINSTLLPPAKYPFAIGDQLLSVDGSAVSDLLVAFAKYSRYGNDRSTQRLAAARIVTRPQQVMPHAVDLGDSAVVAIQRAGGNVETFTIPWVKTGVPLTQIDPVSTPQGAGRAGARSADDAADEALRGLQMSMDPHNEASLGQGSVAPIFALPQGFVRRLGATGDFFLSGTYLANGLRIGYIRIPTYGPSDTVAALAQFQKEIAFFQANTDGLVVDEMRNSGGLLCYGENIASNLIPTNFRPLGYEIRATYEYLASFGAALGNAQAAGNQTLIGQYQTLYNAIAASYGGNQPRTDAVPLCGPSFDRAPAKDSRGNVIAYSKPMIMLIDEFSESTADSVPAMIQDNARGLLVGWRTNGMGGSNGLTISRYQVGDYSEGDTGITLSLMVRKAPVITTDFPPTQYIENVGVRPDVTIDYMTRDNLVNSGRVFVQAFTDVIVQQIGRQ